MRIGVPREIKPLEGRVALVPEAAGELVKRGHQVRVEKGAGEQSGFTDDQYIALGVEIVPDATTLYGESDIIVKVKEPIGQELDLLKAEHVLFSFLHLAAVPELAAKLQDTGLTAVAFETVEPPTGGLPILAPMSDIAGRLAVQIGAHLLHQPMGGKGILLGGLPAASRGNVVIIGAGNAGGNAAEMAARIGASVIVFDRKREKLARMRALGDNVTALYPYHDSLETAIKQADLLIGAVLVTGKRAPHVVNEEMVRFMSPGSVIVDISVDQGGCIETTHPTNYADPTYIWEGVTHFAVTNMPGAVPKTASQALSAALIPYLLRMLEAGWEQDPALQAGINVKSGKVVHPAVREALST
jgi:alanine dehydrogenase